MKNQQDSPMFLQLSMSRKSCLSFYVLFYRTALFWKHRDHTSTLHCHLLPVCLHCNKSATDLETHKKHVTVYREGEREQRGETRKLLICILRQYVIHRNVC